MIFVKEQSIKELIAELYTLNIIVQLENDSLRIRAPKGAVTPELRSKLAANKSELIAFLQEVNHSHNGASNGSMNIESAEHDGNSFPLSITQQRILILNELGNDPTNHNMPSTLEIVGELNIPALRWSLEKISERHTSLRTRFIYTDEPEQYIEPNMPLPFEFHNLVGEREEEIEQIVAETMTHTFNLFEAPLWLVRLLKIKDNQYLFLLNIHHIISDDWSMNIFVQELIALYESRCLGFPSPLAPLNIQYVDYAVWHNEWLEQNEYQQKLAYWEQQLKGIPALLNLP